MKPNRMEAFSDGVLAIIITIMVLELRVPEGDSFHGLTERIPVFLSYLISFIYLGIYWNNHHHLLHVTKSINGGILWANLHLLFWLSLIPFTTSWMGENHLSFAPVMLYGINLLLCAVAYTFLQSCIVKDHHQPEALKKVLGKDVKGKASMAIYLAGILLSLVTVWLSIAAYVIVAILWIVPDKRIERNYGKDGLG